MNIVNIHSIEKKNPQVQIAKSKKRLGEIAQLNKC